MHTKQIEKIGPFVERLEIRQRLSYGEALCHALSTYAVNDPEFRGQFARMIRTRLRTRPASAPREIPRVAEILMPEDTASALSRARWVIDRIADNDLSGSNRAAAMLTAWAAGQPADDAKSIVIGVVGVAIPGVTLGLIRRKETLLVLVRWDLAIQRTLELTQLTSGACLGVLSRAFDAAHGEVNKLEPELSEWFFGGREMEFFGASRNSLGQIKQELMTVDVAHAAAQDKKGDAVLAVSPVVNTMSRRFRWKLEPLRMQML